MCSRKKNEISEWKHVHGSHNPRIRETYWRHNILELYVPGGLGQWVETDPRYFGPDVEVGGAHEYAHTSEGRNRDDGIYLR